MHVCDIKISPFSRKTRYMWPEVGDTRFVYLEPTYWTLAHIHVCVGYTQMESYYRLSRVAFQVLLSTCTKQACESHCIFAAVATFSFPALRCVSILKPCSYRNKFIVQLTSCTSACCVEQVPVSFNLYRLGTIFLILAREKVYQFKPITTSSLLSSPWDLY
jgi:hypothetical protein